MTKSTLIRVVFWAFILNTIWELVQCIYFYDMWSWPFWKATVWMWAAIFGDILIILGLWKVTTLLIPSAQYPPDLVGFAILLIISLVAAFFLESLALELELWKYDSSMPVITIGNREVGISPILQITILPALSIFAADRFRNR